MTSAIAPVHGAVIRDPALWKAAQSLEATFLSEMLKSTSLASVSDSFGGGAGEEQFSGFLVQAHAEEMVKAGGIGLAESIYRSLVERGDAAAWMRSPSSRSWVLPPPVSTVFRPC